ncbi:hypothetical protein [Fimbriiglobus ruber]|nr:hypothetical protein [Fimbriiglobus ruber]
MVHAYMVGADAEALAHGERLLERYPDEIKSNELRQSPQIVAQLKRRRERKTNETDEDTGLPKSFRSWPVTRQIAHQIAALDETWGWHQEQPGDPLFGRGMAIERLTKFGDAAVPALIDAIETDERLTGLVYITCDSARNRTFLGVRHVALATVMAILRTREFEPTPSGDGLAALDTGWAKVTAERLRAYWKMYGRLPFDERMMKVLTDPQTRSTARREAAWNLATHDETVRDAVMMRRIGREVGPEPLPPVRKFNNPTAADAIFSAMDIEFKSLDLEHPGRNSDADIRERQAIEEAYRAALVRLRDERAAAGMAKRAAAANTLSARAHWARAANRLGDRNPLRTLAEDVSAGILAKAPKDRLRVDLEEVVAVLVEARAPEADRALVTLGDPRHPQYPLVLREILDRSTDTTRRSPWLSHPFCLTVLRGALDDRSPRGFRLRIVGNAIVRHYQHSVSYYPIPEYLLDPKTRRSATEECVCDAAAQMLGDLIDGLPKYHPLCIDADERLSAMKVAFDSSAGTYHLPKGWDWPNQPTAPRKFVFVPDPDSSRRREGRLDDLPLLR